MLHANTIGTVYYSQYQSSIGNLCIAADTKGVCRIALPGQCEHMFFKLLTKKFNNVINEDIDIIKLTIIQLKEYFNKSREQFSVPLHLLGTNFQKKVWKQLINIPYGYTTTYGEIAASIGSPMAARAVGGANNKNPVPIIVPCHRVIGKTGKLVGYSSGLNIKRKLLQIEGIC